MRTTSLQPSCLKNLRGLQFLVAIGETTLNKIIRFCALSRLWHLVTGSRDHEIQRGQEHKMDLCLYGGGGGVVKKRRKKVSKHTPVCSFGKHCFIFMGSLVCPPVWRL